MRESELLARIRAIFDAHPPKGDLLIDNGDDGAIFSPGGREVVIAADVAVEGAHFTREWSSPRDIGRKITAANLADICAMGSWPEYLIVTAVIPQRWIDDVEEIARGISQEASLVDAAIIGGDLSVGNELSISITAVGYCDRPLTRSTAKVGDVLVISHIPGWSAAGLDLLKAGKKRNGFAGENRAIEQHLHPSIPYQRYRAAFDALHCATDISDGLLVDASHIAQSSGVTINLQSEFLHDPELSAIGESLHWILNGGEDHVLLGTTSSPHACPGFIVIGEVLAGRGEVLLDGKKMGSEGFRHEWRS